MKYDLLNSNYKDIRGMYYNYKNNKYVVDKRINGNRFSKTFTNFEDAIGYLNWVLCLHNMKPIVIKIKGEYNI